MHSSASDDIAPPIRKRRVALIDYGNYSFLRQASSDLIRSGAPLAYLFSTDVLSPNHLTDDIDHPNVLRVSIGKKVARDALILRGIQEYRWGTACVKLLDKLDPEAVVLANTPLLAQARVQRWCKTRRRPYSVWTQDLHGLAIPDVLRAKFGAAGTLLGTPYRLLDAHILKGADWLTAISETQLPYLSRVMRQACPITVVRNWAELPSSDSEPKCNSWSKERGLDKTFNFLYAGALGFKQDIRPFVELARHFSTAESVRIVIVSEGRGAAQLTQLTCRDQLSNVVVLPFQPYSEFRLALASADVLIASLTQEASSYCVPSKVQTYMCAARPQLVIAPRTNPIAALVEQAGVGTVVIPGDTTGLIEAAQRLFESTAMRERFAQNALSYARRQFSADSIRSSMEMALGWLGTTDERQNSTGNRAPDSDRQQALRTA